MSTEQPPPGQPPPGQPSEEELRRALEAEMDRLTVSDILVQTVVTLVNLGGRKLGLAPGTEDKRDLAQAHDAIEGVRALLPLVEAREGAEAMRPVRDALSQLQMAYAQLASGAPPEGAAQGPPPGGEPGAPPEGEGGGEGPEGQPGQAPGSGPAQRSGRLWVPGQ
jgi:hypothetical protein